MCEPWPDCRHAQRADAGPDSARRSLTTRALLTELHTRATTWNDHVMTYELDKWLKQIPEHILNAPHT